MRSFPSRSEARKELFSRTSREWNTFLAVWTWKADSVTRVRRLEADAQRILDEVDSIGTPELGYVFGSLLKVHMWIISHCTRHRLAWLTRWSLRRCGDWVVRCKVGTYRYDKKRQGHFYVDMNP